MTSSQTSIAMTGWMTKRPFRYVATYKLQDETCLQDTEAPPEERRPSSALRFTESNVEIPMLNGHVMKIPHNTIKQEDINITEEMNKSGCWKSLEPQNTSAE